MLPTKSRPRKKTSIFKRYSTDEETDSKEEKSMKRKKEQNSSDGEGQKSPMISILREGSPKHVRRFNLAA